MRVMPTTEIDFQRVYFQAVRLLGYRLLGC